MADGHEYRMDGLQAEVAELRKIVSADNTSRVIEAKQRAKEEQRKQEIALAHAAQNPLLEANCAESETGRFFGQTPIAPSFNVVRLLVTNRSTDTRVRLCVAHPARRALGDISWLDQR